MSGEQQDVSYLLELLGGEGIPAGPGDDAALVSTEGEILVTTDPVVEGIHFEAGSSPTRIGRKLVNRNFSDLAAMGAWPTSIVVSFCFGPSWQRASRRRLYRSVKAAAEKYQARWVGGDLAAVRGPSVFTLAAIGRPPRGKARVVTRAGLRPEDLLFVTGPLGGSSIGTRHMDFEPRLEWGRRLAERHAPSAMIDVSDGLALDLARLLEASGGLGARLLAERIPLHPARTLARALCEGEDYELLFALPEARSRGLGEDPCLPARARTPIGRVEAEPGIRLQWKDREETIPAHGYSHDLP
ncbi:MAG: thiamine-phosphate kinase [Planctomycetota bacterium]